MLNKKILYLLYIKTDRMLKNNVKMTSNEPLLNAILEDIDVHANQALDP